MSVPAGSTSCSYSAPPWPLVQPSRSWYHRLLASTSRTAISGWGFTALLPSSRISHRVRLVLDDVRGEQVVVVDRDRGEALWLRAPQVELLPTNIPLIARRFGIGRAVVTLRASRNGNGE